MKSFNRTDVAEQVIGACVLAFPIAVTEDVWDLSGQIAPINALMLATVSCFFLSLFIYFIHGKKNNEKDFHLDWKRVLVTYGVTLLVCALILIMIGKLPLFSDTATAVKRIILVAFPASFSATVVDSLR